MSNVINKMDELITELTPTAKRHLGAEKFDDLFAEFQEKRNSTTLQIMLFGSYNAGKSSLINALVGENVAPVADIPTTAAANIYEWNGCHLLDTPGVNAPIDHEELTKEQIKRSELMLFVIREGDQDVKDVYDRLFEMLANGKQVFIVFNHQLDADNLTLSVSKLSNILADYDLKYKIGMDVISKIPVVSVNVSTALTAREKNFQKLADHSGLTDFEDAFKNWLGDFDNDTGYLLQIKQYVHQCMIDPVISLLEKEINTPDVELSEKQYQREALNKEKALVISASRNFIRQEINLLKPEIVKLFEAGSSEGALVSGVQGMANELMRKVSLFFQERYESIDATQTVISSPVQVDNPSTPTSEEFLKNAENMAIKFAKGVDHEAIIKGGLLKLRGLKIPGIKGRWEKTLGKWAGKAAPWLVLGITAIEFGVATKREAAENEKLRQQQLQFHQMVEGGAASIEMSVKEATEDAIEGQFEVIVDELTTDIDGLLSGQEQAEQDYELVCRIASEIDALVI